MSGYLPQALDAIERGLGVLPLAEGRKAPSGRYGQRSAVTSPEVAAELAWTHGVAVMLGDSPRHYVLDADTPEGCTLVRALALAPDTLRVRTARGVHAYFLAPDGPPLRQGVRVLGHAHAVDGKGVAGSGTHTVAVWAGPDGREIEHDAPIAPLHPELVRRIGTREAGSAAVPTLGAAENARLRVLYSRHASHEDLARIWAGDLLPWLQYELAATDCWGAVFYRASCRLGERGVARGTCSLDEANALLSGYFRRVDQWGADPTNVLRSIRRGLTHGAAEGLTDSITAAVMSEHARV